VLTTPHRLPASHAGFGMAGKVEDLDAAGVPIRLKGDEDVA
jgi:hypothetical protein